MSFHETFVPHSLGFLGLVALRGGREDAQGDQESLARQLPQEGTITGIQTRRGCLRKRRKGKRDLAEFSSLRSPSAQMFPSQLQSLTSYFKSSCKSGNSIYIVIQPLAECWYSVILAQYLQKIRGSFGTIIETLNFLYPDPTFLTGFSAYLGAANQPHYSQNKYSVTANTWSSGVLPLPILNYWCPDCNLNNFVYCMPWDNSCTADKGH